MFCFSLSQGGQKGNPWRDAAFCVTPLFSDSWGEGWWGLLVGWGKDAASVGEGANGLAENPLSALTADAFAGGMLGVVAWGTICMADSMSTAGSVLPHVAALRFARSLKRREGSLWCLRKERSVRSLWGAAKALLSVLMGRWD